MVYVLSPLFKQNQFQLSPVSYHHLGSSNKLEGKKNFFELILFLESLTFYINRYFILERKMKYLPKICFLEIIIDNVISDN
jgi:hypothetical protein